MRPLIIILISCLLLLSLSLSINAMGNDYTFSPAWWSTVFNNTLINGFSQSTGNPTYVSGRDLEYDNYAETLYLTTDSVKYQGISTIFTSGLNERFPYLYDIQIPLNISIVRRSQFSIELYLTLDSFNVDLVSPLLVSGSFSIVPEYTFTRLGHSSINVDSNMSSYFQGDLYLLTINYVNDTSSSLNFDYLSFTVRQYNTGTSTAPDSIGISIGSLADYNNNIILPDSFVFAIDNINNRLQDVYVRVNDMRTTLNELNSTAELMKDNSDTTVEQLESIQSLIDELSDKLSSSGSVSQQIYQTLTVPSSEVSQSVAQLEETVNQAKEELSAINETIKTVLLPSITDVDDVVSTDTSQSLEDALGNSDVRSTLSTVFSFGQFSSMLLIMLTIATVGYILYGKKG